jgi:hypothetical protein
VADLLVELAGALAEMKSNSSKDYPDLDIAKWKLTSFKAAGFLIP